MRQIKQFTYALEQVLFKKKEGEKQEAQDIIEQTLKELPKENNRRFQELSLADTLSTLKIDGYFNAELALIVADLLYEKGQFTNKSESKKCYMQALVLYQKALKDPKTAFPLQATGKISGIKKKLDASDLEKIEAQLD